MPFQGSCGLTTTTPIAIFSDLVKPESTRLRSGLGRVFVFGGPIADINDPAASLRDAFWRRAHEEGGALASALSTPEEYPEWHTLLGYDDLLRFEQEAGQLSKLLVIFSESPGSFAELGAYANEPELSSRTLIVLDAKYRSTAHQTSFLNLGPIRRIEKSLSDPAHATCIISPKSKTELGDHDFELIRESIITRLNSEEKTTKLSKNNTRERLLVILEATSLFQVLEVSDSIHILNHLGLSTCREEAKRYFILLNTLRGANLVERGHKKYLVPMKNQDIRFVDFGGTSEHPFDPLRFKVAAREHIEGSGLLSAIYNEGSKP